MNADMSDQGINVEVVNKLVLELEAIEKALYEITSRIDQTCGGGGGIGGKNCFEEIPLGNF